MNRFAYHAKGNYELTENDKYTDIVIDTFTLNPNQICLLIGGYGNSIPLSVDTYCHFVFPLHTQLVDYILYFNKSNRCSGLNGGGATCFCIIEPINTITIDFRVFNYDLEKLYNIQWDLVAIKLNKSE